jgi:hypothetical protein
MLATSPSTPGILIPLPYSIPNTRSGCFPPRELLKALERNSAPKKVCFGIGPHHGGARNAPIHSLLSSSDAGLLPVRTGRRLAPVNHL